MTAIKPTRAKRLLPSINRKSYIPIAFLVLAGSQVLLLLGFFMNTMRLTKLANQRPPTLVQMVDGQSVVGQAYRYDYRDPKLLQNTAQQWVALTYSWGFPRSEKLMQLPDKNLSGMTGEKGFVPMTTDVASHLLTPDGRDEFLKGFSEDIFSQAYQGDQASAFRPLQMLEPEETESGWVVEVIGERHVTTPANEVGILRPMHLEIHLIATEPSDKPVVGDPTDLEKEVYKLLQSGVRVEKVVSLGT